MGRAMTHDALYIGYGSALAYWRVVRAHNDPMLPESIPYGTGYQATRTQMRRALEIIKTPPPLHTFSATKAARTQSSLGSAHFWPAPTPANLLVRIAPHTFVATPELAFIQAASTCDLIDLALIAYELCGTYIIEHWNETRSISLDRPLSNIDVLARLSRTYRTYGTRGAKRALESLKYVREGSNSAAESTLALALMLPLRLGGYRLSGFALNQRISLSEMGREILGYPEIRPDFTWPDAHVALEYDSDTWHLNRVKHARDARRRACLTAMGYAHYTLTSLQIADLQGLDAMFASIQKRLGIRGRRPCDPSRRSELHTRLFIKTVDPLFG